MRAVVTGAAGFIGSALVQTLAARGHEVFAVVLPGEQLPKTDGVVRVEMDLSRPNLQLLPSGADCVIHLAQSPRYREFPAGAADMFVVNLASTRFLLDWALAQGVGALVFASTGSVYLPGPKPFSESSPTGFHDMYTWTKFSAEGLLWLHRDLVSVRVARLFIPFGPGQRNKLVPTLIQKVTVGAPITLAGDDGIKLNPVYIDDVVEALAALAQAPRSLTVNVAGSQVLTIREMAEIIGLVVGREPVFKLLPPAENADLAADISLLERELGLVPKVDFETGIRRMIERS